MRMTERQGNQRKYGFTLVEILAAMAVLLILMLLLMRIFAESSRAFERGNTSAMRDASLRAALDVMRKDLECIVIDEHLGMYKMAQWTENNFDRIMFVTMNGDQDDGRSYQLIDYQVKLITDSNDATKVIGTKLVRGSADFDAARAQGIDPLGEDHSWWDDASAWQDANLEETLVENVVQFDIWICSTNAGENLASGNYDPYFNQGLQWYDSTRNYPVTETDADAAIWPSNRPPAYVDVYLQVTSDDAMKRGRLVLEASEGVSGTEVERLVRTANGIFYRESQILVARVVPIMGVAQRRFPFHFEQ